VHDQQSVDSPAPDPDAQRRQRPSFVQRVCIGTLFGFAALVATWLATVGDTTLFEASRIAKVSGAAALAGILAGAIPFRRRWLTLAAYVPTLAAVVSVASVVKSVRDAEPFHLEDFECDGPPGEVSSGALRGWSYGMHVHVLSGRIVPGEPRLDPKWAPSAGVRLLPKDRKAEYGVKLSGSAHEVNVVSRDRQGELAREALGILIPVDSPLSFELRWAGRTAVLWVDDGAWLGRREIDFAPEKIELFCSTGRARFEELWRDRIPLADAAELGPVRTGSFKGKLCELSDDVLLNLIRIRKEAGPEVTGVSITNCESTPLRLVARSTRFTLQEREGESWRVNRDLTPYLCCDRQLGILDEDENWSLSGLPANLDPTRTLRFELRVGERKLHSEEFVPGNRR
jgi:hypothetical protein